MRMIPADIGAQYQRNLFRDSGSVAAARVRVMNSDSPGRPVRRPVFGRNGAYGGHPAAPRRRCSAVAVRAAGVEYLDTVARLALVEI